MSDRSFIAVELEGAIAVVRVNRPDKLNALNAETITQLDVAVRRIADDDAIRGVILTGSGDKAFVAGADIAELAQMGPLTGIAVSRAGQATFRMLEQLPKPVIAAVNGFALGGGLELALACHLRIAGEKARFGLPEVKLGIIPGYGGTVRLPRLIGKGRALEMILTGEMINAEEAFRIGLVNRVVAQGELLPYTKQLLEKIIANGPVAIRMAIEAVDRAMETTLDDSLLLESNMFGLLSATDDMHEGMKAFLEKRTPRFEGR
jgi:enoyl-CoA hydratase